MAQLVGSPCVICRQPIHGRSDGTFCPACECPVHKNCAAERAADRANMGCPQCGAHDRDVMVWRHEQDAAQTSLDRTVGGNNIVRGILFLLGSLCLAFLCGFTGIVSITLVLGTFATGVILIVNGWKTSRDRERGKRN